MTLGLQGCLLEGRGAEGVEAEAWEAKWLANVFCMQLSRLAGEDRPTFARMNYGHLTGEGKNGALASGIRDLRCSSANNGNHTGCVDDAALGLPMLPQRPHSVLGAIPNALDIDIESQIPDSAGALLRVTILGVHDAGVIEHDINTTPGIKVCDRCLHLVFLGHVDYLYLDFTGMVGDDALDLGESFIEGRVVDVCHEDGSALLEEEDCRFETDTAVGGLPLALVRRFDIGIWVGSNQ